MGRRSNAMKAKDVQNIYTSAWKLRSLKDELIATLRRARELREEIEKLEK